MLLLKSGIGPNSIPQNRIVRWGPSKP